MLLRFVVKRILLSIPLLIGITLVTFVVSHLVPADPLTAVLPERAWNNPETVQMYRERWGLDRPLHEQYLIYLRNLLRGDLGESYTTRRPVGTDLRLFFPATIELAAAAMLYAVTVGIALGVVSAVWSNRLAPVEAMIKVD